MKLRRGGAILILGGALQAACSGSVTSHSSATDSGVGGARALGTGGASQHAGAGGSIGDSGTPNTGGASPGTGGISPNAGGFEPGGTGGVLGCTLTNAGIESCDGIDNDCDGRIDEPKTASDPNGIDFLSPEHCGSCANPCRVKEAYGVRCIPEPGSAEGTASGKCDYDHCALLFWDVDGNRENGCEYFCDRNPARVPLPDLGGPDCTYDDDCDGSVDEDVDLCNDVENCGLCGQSCLRLPHVTAATCGGVSDGGSCLDATCRITGCATGWANDDARDSNGCEHWTGPPPVSTVEVCDGYDNDNDGLIDETGPDGIDGSADPSNPLVHIGDVCGSDIGACQKGKMACLTGTVTCIGGVVASPETCDGKDNDCNGLVDDDVPAASRPVCPAGTRCAKLSNGLYECAEPCSSGEFRCPSEALCETLTLSGRGGQAEVCIPQFSSP